MNDMTGHLKKARIKMVVVTAVLDERTTQTAKSTAPVLKEHSHDIGRRFYELLFAKVSELNNMFNQTNQRRGLQ
ncbi:globin family protein [Alicyclobacillus dauci]|uniref:hypothetical protein n=1 Tax=Alicyclobacillus dauci TaxID=1475485 RepID=UPI002DD431ED|nr:hypothetical protein [Alicyclobacillus dauci]